MRTISLMLKPVSSSCNLNCRYCFYNSLSECREQKNYGIMSDEILEDAISKAFDFADETVYISFHGGEPLLRGIEFYEKAIVLIEKYRKKQNVVLAFQTNGTLIDKKWCEFFKQNKCLIGISLDGDETLNELRVNHAGQNSFRDVMNAIDLLQYYEIEFNVLSVVTKQVAKNAEKMYRFFTSQGFKFLQFTPCLKPYGNQKCDLSMYMTGEEYGNFLIEIMKLYFDDYMKGNYVSIRQLDNFVRLVAGKPAFQCGMNGCCSIQFVVEADGSVFPCDFYSLDEYKIGDITSDDFFSILASNKHQTFLKQSFDVEEKCKKCKWWKLCKNGCKREREDVEKCVAYDMLFSKMIQHFKFLTQGIDENSNF